MIDEKPTDYSFNKVTKVVNEELINFFGSLYDQRDKNLSRDLNTLLAHIAVYSLANKHNLIYLKCAYQDLEVHGFIKPPNGL